MLSRINGKRSGLRVSYKTSFAIRLCGLFLVALALFACSAPLPIVQPSRNDMPPVNAPEISLVPSVAMALPTDEEAPTAAIPEENNVFFSPGSTTVDETGKEKLRQHATLLKQNPKQFVTLVGHTDGQGSRNYNLAIAEERLTAVSKWLRSYGVPAGKIRRNRIGSVKNLPACRSMSCRKQMRRVELLFSP